MSNAVLTIGSNVGYGDNSPFAWRTPKPEHINAVKLTDTNIRDIAAHILKTLGGTVRVETPGDPFNGGIFRDGLFIAVIGDWVAEDYDYVKEEAVFRKASIAERQKYDLR